MLYLEDYLEMIEHLPQELRDRFTEMRELDLAVQNNMDSLEKKTRYFFQQCKRGELQEEAVDNEYENLRKEYYKVLEDADEKVTIAAQIHELVERYLRRLDSELFKFKCELEADNNGITEILEKRSLEMDGASSASTALMNVINMHHKENRFFGSSMGLGANLGASNSLAVMGGGGLSGHVLPSIAVAQLKDNRYRTTTRPEKRRDSSTSSLTGAPPEKRPNLGTGLTPTNSALRPITPSMGTHAVLSPAVGSVAAPGVAAVAYNLQQMAGGSATNALAAAAGQAIATTHQLQQGRRAGNMKASYEAIHGVGGGPTEFWISRDIASAATAAQGSLQNVGSEKKQKKKANLNLSNAGAAVTSAVPSSAMSLLSSSSSMSVDSVDMLPSSSMAATGVATNLGLNALGGSVSSASAAANRANVASTSAAAAINNMQLNENGLAVEQTPDGEWQYDPNEPRYCTCNQVSYGDMVACDNDACPYEWFHYPCVGITQPPKGKWYCPKCTASMRRRGNRKN